MSVFLYRVLRECQYRGGPPANGGGAWSPRCSVLACWRVGVLACWRAGACGLRYISPRRGGGGSGSPGHAWVMLG